MAKAGDGPALRLCMDRLLPARRDRHVTFALPAIETASDAAKAAGALLSAVSAGEITPQEAAELGKLIEGLREGSGGVGIRGTAGPPGAEDHAMNRDHVRAAGRAGDPEAIRPRHVQSRQIDAAVSAALAAHRAGGLLVELPVEQNRRAAVEAALRADA